MTARLRLLTNAKVFHEAGEALIQPEALPPVHRHQIAEPTATANHAKDQFKLETGIALGFELGTVPLVGKLVGHNGHHTLCTPSQHNTKTEISFKVITTRDVVGYKKASSRMRLSCTCLFSALDSSGS